MSKVINKVSFEIEHYNGDTYMGFEVYINDDGTIGVSKTYNCCVADIDGDYIFDTNNSLYRIQADEPMECAWDVNEGIYLKETVQDEYTY